MSNFEKSQKRGGIEQLTTQTRTKFFRRQYIPLYSSLLNSNRLRVSFVCQKISWQNNFEYGPLLLFYFSVRPIMISALKASSNLVADANSACLFIHIIGDQSESLADRLLHWRGDGRHGVIPEFASKDETCNRDNEVHEQKHLYNEEWWNVN